jgi:hypothetical protein
MVASTEAKNILKLEIFGKVALLIINDWLCYGENLNIF